MTLPDSDPASDTPRLQDPFCTRISSFIHGYNNKACLTGLLVNDLTYKYTAQSLLV